MAIQKEGVIDWGSVNITMHPHGELSYIGLLNDVSLLRKKAVIRGKYKGIITRPQVVEVEGDVYAYFSIFRYYDLSPFGLWLDERTQTPLESTADHPLADIPGELKPELVIVPAVFVGRGHQIYFSVKSISPRSAENFFYGLFDDPVIQDKYGLIDVTMVQDRKQLDSILSIENLTALYIHIKRPNPDDDYESDEARIARRMEEMGTYQWDQALKGRARRREPIHPDEGLSPFLHVALENGEVRSEGYENEEKVTRSSKNIPRIRRTRVIRSAGVKDYVDAVRSVHRRRG